MNTPNASLRRKGSPSKRSILGCARPKCLQAICDGLSAEKIDALGRPEEIKLIFNRKMPRQRRKRERFCTRIVTRDVTPSLNIHYKNSRIKQYHKENRALRTETTINNTYDFGVGKRLHNLPKLREIGFAANRRLVEIERLSRDCILSEHTFQAVDHRSLLAASEPRGCVLPTCASMRCCMLSSRSGS
jgi:hypothetical protein